MFKSNTPISDERLAQMKSECFSIYSDCMVKYTKLIPHLHFLSYSFHSGSGFLTNTNKDDYELFTKKIKDLSDALEPVRKHFGIK